MIRQWRADHAGPAFPSFSYCWIAAISPLFLPSSTSSLPSRGPNKFRFALRKYGPTGCTCLPACLLARSPAYLLACARTSVSPHDGSDDADCRHAAATMAAMMVVVVMMMVVVRHVFFFLFPAGSKKFGKSRVTVVPRGIFPGIAHHRPVNDGPQVLISLLRSTSPLLFSSLLLLLLFHCHLLRRRRRIYRADARVARSSILRPRETRRTY